MLEKVLNIGDTCYYDDNKCVVIGSETKDHMMYYILQENRPSINEGVASPIWVKFNNLSLESVSDHMKRLAVTDYDRIMDQYINEIYPNLPKDLANKWLFAQQQLHNEHFQKYALKLPWCVDASVEHATGNVEDMLKRTINSVYGAKSAILSKPDYTPLGSVIPGSIRIDESIMAKYCKQDIDATYTTFDKIRKIIAKANEEMRARHMNIKAISIKEEKKMVTVVFDDGTMQQVVCTENDTFDPMIGAALCMVYQAFGSKSKFKKVFKSKAKFVPVKQKPKKEAKKKTTKKSKKK